MYKCLFSAELRLRDKFALKNLHIFIGSMATFTSGGSLLIMNFNNDLEKLLHINDVLRIIKIFVLFPTEQEKKQPWS